MNRYDAAVIICILAALSAGVFGLVRFHTFDVPYRIEYNDGLSGEGTQPVKKAENQEVRIGEFFRKTGTLPPKLESASWSGFRGDDRSNVVKDSPALADEWGSEGPRVVWRQKLGEGYATPVIKDNLVYLLDYDEAEEADSLRCFSFETGQEIWRRYYKVAVRRNHGKSRTVPAVAGKAVVTLGPMGHVMSVDALNGDLLWTKDLVREFGSEIPQWYAGQCVLADGNSVILAPAGKDVLMISFDAVSGKELWRTPNPDGIKMSHSSVMKFTLRGQPQYVYCGTGGTVGVAAEGENAGKILWRNTEWKPPVTAPSPVKIGDARIFMCAGYGFGGAVLEVKEDGSAKILKAWKPQKGVSSEQQTPVIYGKMMYSIMPKDAAADRQMLVACDIDSDGLAITARSGMENRFGIGPYIAVDGKIYALDDEGVLTMLRHEGDSFKILGRYRILPGHDSWGPLAFADGFMIARDLDSMVCIDLRKNGENK